MIDLRNPEGKYGGTAKSLAGLMTIMQQVKEKKAERDLTNKLLKGITSGETMDSIMGTLTKPEDEKGDFVGTLARAVIDPFNPWAKSRQPTPLEEELKNSYVKGKLTNALNMNKWGAPEVGAAGGPYAGGTTQRNMMTGEIRASYPRAAATKPQRTPTEIINILDRVDKGSLTITDSQRKALSQELLGGLNLPEEEGAAGEISGVTLPSVQARLAKNRATAEASQKLSELYPRLPDEIKQKIAKAVDAGLTAEEILAADDLAPYLTGTP